MMPFIAIVVYWVFLGVCPNTGNAESCTRFTTKTSVSGENATVRFSLPDVCTQKYDLRQVTVSTETRYGACVILPKSWARESVWDCILDLKSREYSLTRQLGATLTGKEKVFLTADFNNHDPVRTTVLLDLTDTTPLQDVTTAYSVNIDNKLPTTTKHAKHHVSSGNRDTNEGQTSSVEAIKDGGQGGTGSKGPAETGAGDKAAGNDKPTEKDESSGTKDDNPSFNQTPAFGFVMAGVVIAIILILLVVLILRHKGISLSVVRRARNSVAIPDDYEHPRGSHHYERPIFRGRQQQPLPSPPPPSNPVFNRDSLLDPNYAVIDDVSGGYEVPKLVVPSVPAAGGSTQAESSL